MTKILLVEDDKSLREIYGVRLLAEGYDIVSAGDGEEALAMAIKEKPKLIISDVMMPKISGFDMLDILRSTTETRDIKVIMMTALSSDDQRNRGEQLGADRYLVKSQVGIEDVVRTVHEVLEDVVQTAPAAPTTPAEPVQPSAAPTPAADDSISAPVADPVVSSSVAPGNDGAGPLPPQPEIAEDSGLPQPTAPFTSPRPTNLGERSIQPLEPTEESSGVTAEEIARELQASADPVTSQVDQEISDADVANDSTATTDSAPDFSTPAPVAPQDSTPTPTPAVDPFTPTTPTTPVSPQQQTDETAGTQPVNPSTPPTQPQQ